MSEITICKHEEWEGIPEVDACCKKCGKDEVEVGEERLSPAYFKKPIFYGNGKFSEQSVIELKRQIAQLVILDSGLQQPDHSPDEIMAKRNAAYRKQEEKRRKLLARSIKIALNLSLALLCFTLVGCRQDAEKPEPKSYTERVDENAPFRLYLSRIDGCTYVIAYKSNPTDDTLAIVHHGACSNKIHGNNPGFFK
jgi:hypothetical protein